MHKLTLATVALVATVLLASQHKEGPRPHVPTPPVVASQHKEHPRPQLPGPPKLVKATVSHSIAAIVD